jgi:hypothetical protein
MSTNDGDESHEDGDDQKPKPAKIKLEPPPPPKPPKQHKPNVLQQYVSGTLPPPIRPGFLLLALFGTFILVAAVLLLANQVPGIANFVDARYFQVILTVLISFVVGVFIFGFTAGATARMNLGIGKVLIDFGGPMAAVGGLLWIILPNLTPTTSLTVYLQDGRSASGASGTVFRVPEGLDIVLQLPEGSAMKTVVTDTQFGYLPKGVDLPVALGSDASWKLVGLSPPDCASPATDRYVIKAGCRAVWLRLESQKKFDDLAHLPPTGLAFNEGTQVTLRQVIDALVRELQSSASARDPNVFVTAPDWNVLGEQIAQATFVWQRPPDRATTCVMARFIEQAVNSAHPDRQVWITVLKSAIEVKAKDATGGRPHDTCL